MKTRVISGIIGVIILLIIMLSNEVVMGVAVFLLAVIGINEIFKAFKNLNYNPSAIIGYFSCIPLIFLTFEKYLLNSINLTRSVVFFIFLILIVEFLLILFKSEKYTFLDIALTNYGIIYIVYLFSFVILTRNLENGSYFIWIIFIGAWITDSSAYFVGVNFGKNKILPKISPNKTIEGSIGGVLGCVIATYLYGIIIINSVYQIPFYHYIILGILNGIISQIGDWTASSIKRKTNIKDFGNLMPGHGGVLDRCDSILFIAPIVYFYLIFLL